jgi:hypothetical protein
MATQVNQLPIFSVIMVSKMYLAWMRDMKAGQILIKNKIYFELRLHSLFQQK